jgi:hypothetical protein
MSLKDLEVFLESIQSMKEYVNPRELTSPNAHKIRGIARREKRKSDSAKEISIPLSNRADLHKTSPLKKKDRQIVQMKIGETVAKSKKSDINEFNLNNTKGDQPDWRSLDDVVGITPDHLYMISGSGKQATPWVYFPETNELFFGSKTPMNLKLGENNFNLGNNYFGEKLSRHSDLLEFIVNIARDEGGKTVKNNMEYYEKLKKNNIINVDNKMIMGRYFDGIMSIWNNIEDDLYKKLVNRLIKVHPTISKVNSLWMNALKNDIRG